ncbi:hypothetical protein ACTXT7_013755 [Hymenolepis weldensis]
MAAVGLNSEEENRRLVTMPRLRFSMVKQERGPPSKYSTSQSSVLQLKQIEKADMVEATVTTLSPPVILLLLTFSNPTLPFPVDSGKWRSDIVSSEITISNIINAHMNTAQCKVCQLLRLQNVLKGHGIEDFRCPEHMTFYIVTPYLSLLAPNGPSALLPSLLLLLLEKQIGSKSDELFKVGGEESDWTCEEEKGMKETSSTPGLTVGTPGTYLLQATSSIISSKKSTLEKADGVGGENALNFFPQTTNTLPLDRVKFILPFPLPDSDRTLFTLMDLNNRTYQSSIKRSDSDLVLNSFDQLPLLFEYRIILYILPTAVDRILTVLKVIAQDTDSPRQLKSSPWYVLFIRGVLELQHTLVDLSKRVDTVREENANLRTANQILGQYIEKLMATSSIFQSSSPPPVSHQSHVSMSSSTHMDGSDSAIGGFQYEESSELASEDDIA